MGRGEVVKFWLPAGCAALLLSGCAHRYKVEGIVLQTNPGTRTMLVSHRPTGKMPAMSMEFQVSPKQDFSKLTPGARVRFDLRNSEARNIRVESTALDNVKVEAPKNELHIGEIVPDFSLTDQNSRTVHLSDFHGRAVALDFIYTRCPLPNVCPRLSANFAYIFKHLHDVQMLSITIDPEWDTPAVLSDYARRWQSDGERWRFLTGGGEQIRNVAGMFGLIYWPEEGSITHTVATAIISPGGKLAAKIDGSNYRPEQLRDLITHISGS
jgi:protein SCO1/2